MFTGIALLCKGASTSSMLAGVRRIFYRQHTRCLFPGAQSGFCARGHGAVFGTRRALGACAQDDVPEVEEEVLGKVLKKTPANLDGVTIVRNAKQADEAIRVLRSFSKGRFVAWDTETTGVDPTRESPVGKGRAICMSAYCGADVDFGNGPRLYVDCLDAEGGGYEMVDRFKEYFEDADLDKVWHNYSFDRHILENHGIKAKGFGGDTMHMARLADTSRKKYSLEELCKDGEYIDAKFRKASMKERFGAPMMIKSRKKGDALKEGKKVIVPETIELQRSEVHGDAWIEYAVSDAELTYGLMDALFRKLGGMEILPDGNAMPMLPFKNLKGMYLDLFVPFANVLIHMERVGFKIDVEMLKAAEERAENDRACLETKFRKWASTKSADAEFMNINSGKQKQQLFFAPCANKKLGEKMPETQIFKVEQLGLMGKRYEAELAEKAASEEAEKAALEEAEKAALEEAEKAASEEAEKKLLAGEGVENEVISTGRVGKKKSKKGKSKKSGGAAAKRSMKRSVELTGMGLTPSVFTAKGWPSVSAASMRKQAGNPRNDPPIYGDAAHPATCLAIDDMMESSAVSTLLSSFIVPLQTMVDDKSRVHASLNLNTETGRLSSRRPNLQNQPALEKDRYKIRDAFVSEPGKKLIVADYGQLELRLLAHITKCESMISAFEAGGDFHSRTALGMYEHVAEAVQRGDCLLEWNDEDGAPPPVPLLKDMFTTERRRAKTLNFSIAYGKTAIGLAKDWDITRAEAEETVERWYTERQEVKRWQKHCRAFALKHKFVDTIIGRRRHLPHIDPKNHTFKEINHAQRAAINAPLQGSAADLVMIAMIRLHENTTLNSELGWRMVLQVHDEIILEGPEESAEAARKIVREIMLNPLGQPLRVAMTVDPQLASSWYQAK